jgi:hypothetical protein
LFWGLAAATAALTIVAGSGTFGFFSSSTVNPGNAFFSGILEISNSKNNTFILSASNMQPGDSLSRIVTLSYGPTSTLDMNYTVQRTTVSGTSFTPFCQALEIVVTRNDDGQAANDGAVIPTGTVESAAGATLDTFAVAAHDMGSLNNDGNTTDTFTFQVTFVNDLNNPQNGLQNKECTVTYTWEARQQAINDDLVTAPAGP